jgi:hypothetical protein
MPLSLYLSCKIHTLKIRGTIYLVLGILFIVWNILMTIVQWKVIRKELETGPEGVGFLIGSQLFLYLGLVLVFAWRRVQKKIARKEQETMLNSFLKDVGNKQ